MVDLDEYDPPERPDFRRVGKGTPYVLDLDGKRARFSRSSGAGKILDDESNLTDWKLRTVVAGAAQRPELMAKASTLDVDTDKKALRDIAEECLVAGKGQRRAIVGTAVHAMFDHIDRQDGWTPPPNFMALCQAYEEIKAEWGLEVAGIELHCINDQFRLAGTLDRRFRTTKTLVAPDGTIIPIGSVLVVDHKTGKELEYAAGSYATQLAAYVDSMAYDVTTDERSPFDPPNFPDWALIIHADSAGTDIDVYWVDVNAGRLGLQLAQEVKAWRRRNDLLTIGRLPKPVGSKVDAWPPDGVAVVDGPGLPAEAPQLPQDGPEHDQGTDRAEYLRGRVRAVLAFSDLAAKQLQRQWPPGIPGLKQPGHSMADLDLIELVIEKVEADHSVPFYPAWKPADEVEASKSRHPSSGNPGADLARIATHPRNIMLQRWFDIAAQTIKEGISDVRGITNVMLAFADFAQDEWSDADVETMLDGSIRAIGLAGIDQLGMVTDVLTKQLMTLGFAIASGNARLLFTEGGEPVVRIIADR